MRPIALQGFVDSEARDHSGTAAYRFYIVRPAVQLHEEPERSLAATIERVGRELARNAALHDAGRDLHKSSIVRRFNRAKADHAAGVANKDWYFSIEMEYQPPQDSRPALTVPYYLLAFVGHPALRPAELAPAPRFDTTDNSAVSGVE